MMSAEEYERRRKVVYDMLHAVVTCAKEATTDKDTVIEMVEGVMIFQAQQQLLLESLLHEAQAQTEILRDIREEI